MPNVRLHVVEAMSAYLDDFVQAGRLDVALLYDHKAFEHVAWTEMMVEDLMLFVSPESSMAAKKESEFRRVFQLPIVLPGRPNVLRIVTEKIAARHHIAVKAMDCDSLPAIARLVRYGGFMAVMPHFAFADEIARGELMAIPIVKPTPSWRLSVVVSQRTLNTRGSEAVAEVMADVIADMVQLGAWKAKLRGSKQRRATSQKDKADIRVSAR